MKHLLCFGFGFSAKVLAARLSYEGWRITGTHRTGEGAAPIREPGYEAALFDGNSASVDVVEALQSATHIVISAPPGEAGDPVLVHHGQDIANAPNLIWAGYLSTVGVYGDHGGGWVDETTPASPCSERSKRRLKAENAWLAIEQAGAVRVQVFRLSGIYGPGRSAVEQIKSGRARRIIKPGQVFNRIHVEDIAGALEAAIGQRGSHSIYNVTDDEPAPPQDVIAYAAELLGVAAPPEIAYAEADLSPMAKSFYAELKRVKNDRIKSDLGLQLRYPTYREGIAAIVNAGK